MYEVPSFPELCCRSGQIHVARTVDMRTMKRKELKEVIPGSPMNEYIHMPSSRCPREAKGSRVDAVSARSELRMLGRWHTCG